MKDVRVNKTIFSTQDFGEIPIVIAQIILSSFPWHTYIHYIGQEPKAYLLCV